MILYICVFVYVCVYIVCIYLVMILTFKSRYFLSFHLKDVFLYEVCMFCFRCCLWLFGRYCMQPYGLRSDSC